MPLVGTCQDLQDYRGGRDYSPITSATTLLPRQDNPAPSDPVSGASSFVVSCGVRLSEVGLAEIRKPQVGSYDPLTQPPGFLQRTARLAARGVGLKGL